MTRTSHTSLPINTFSLRRIGCLLILLFVIQNAHSQQIPHTNHFDPNNCLSQTADNRPQWQDVGLQDILFAIGQPTVPAPNNVRLPYDYITPQHYTNLLPQYQLHCSRAGVSPGQLRKSTLYLWHFLRL